MTCVNALPFVLYISQVTRQYVVTYIAKKITLSKAETLAMAALGLHVSLDSSGLSSCTSFRATRVPAVCNAQTVRLGKVGGIRCSLSEEDSVPSVARRNALTRLVATGLALTLSTSSAFADVAPFNKVGRTTTAEKADKLLKAAEKPPRFGPGDIPDGDAGQSAQKGGSGAIGSAQDKAGEVKENVQGFFGQAKDTAQDKVEETKQNAKGLFGKGPEKLKGEAQGKAEETKQNVQGFFGQAQGKGEGLVGDAQGKAGSVQGKVKSDVDTAAGAAKDAAGGASENTDGLIGSIKKGLRIQ